MGKAKDFYMRICRPMVKAKDFHIRICRPMVKAEDFHICICRPMVKAKDLYQYVHVVPWSTPRTCIFTYMYAHGQSQ